MATKFKADLDSTRTPGEPFLSSWIGGGGAGHWALGSRFLPRMADQNDRTRATGMAVETVNLGSDGIPAEAMPGVWSMLGAWTNAHIRSKN